MLPAFVLLEGPSHLPEGKAINAQNLIVPFIIFMQAGLVRSEVFPSGGFRWATALTHHLLHNMPHYYCCSVSAMPPQLRQ